MPLVCAYYAESGYTVYVDGVPVYSAGGNPHDSQAPGRSPADQVGGWARTCAEEIAEARGGTVGGVYYLCAEWR